MINNKSNLSVKLVIFALGIYVAMGIPNIVAPALQDFTNVYPEQSFVNIALIMTLFTIGSLPTNLFGHVIVKKLGLKACCVISPIGGVFFSLLPALVKLPFSALLTTRFMTGLFVGLGMPLGPTVVARYFPNVTQRSAVMGWAQSFTNLITMAFTMCAGALAAINTNYVWYASLIGVLAIVLALFMPAPEHSVSDHSSDNAPAVQQNKSNEKMPGTSWFYISMYGLLQLFSAAFLINYSTLIVGGGFGTALDSSFVFSCFTVGGLIAGLVFGRLYNLLKHKLLPIASVIMALCFSGFCVSKSMPAFEVCAFVLGLCFCTIASGVMTKISEYTPTSKMVFANGIAMGTTNILMFLYNYILAFVANLTGQESNMYFAFYLSIGCFVLYSLLLIVSNSKAKKAA